MWEEKYRLVDRIIIALSKLALLIFLALSDQLTLIYSDRSKKLSCVGLRQVMEYMKKTNDIPNAS